MKLELNPLGAEVEPTDPFLEAQQHGREADYHEMRSGGRLYEEAGNPFDASGGCLLDGSPMPCSMVERVVQMGAAAFEFPNIMINGIYGRRPRVEPIEDRGLGLYGVWVPTNGDNGQEYRLFSLSSTQRSKKPKLKPIFGPKAKFDYERLRTCLSEKFLVNLGSGEDGPVGYDSAAGSFHGSFGSSDPIPFSIRIDSTSRTLRDIRKSTGNPKAMGMSDTQDRWLVYVGSDAFKGRHYTYRLAAEIHEIGNKIYDEFAVYGLKKPEVSSNYLRNVVDDDAGMALEECVFGGFVNPEGRVVR